MAFGAVTAPVRPLLLFSVHCWPDCWGGLAVWIGMRKNSVPATLVAAVALVCLACQTGSIALSVPPFLLLILAVAALAAVFAVLDLVRLIESKEV